MRVDVAPAFIQKNPCEVPRAICRIGLHRPSINREKTPLEKVQSETCQSKSK
jgi:hypothetical protein